LEVRPEAFVNEPMAKQAWARSAASGIT
jgi:hypothetical protein